MAEKGNHSTMHEALVRALEYCESDQRSGIAYSDNDVLVPMLREALDAQQPSQGNSAALLKAMEEIDKDTDLLDIAEDIGLNVHPSHSFVAVKIRNIARSAISKPPRNCDRFHTVEDAKTAWRNYKMSCPTPPGGWGDVDLLDWFLAKAEGGEG